MKDFYRNVLSTLTNIEKDEALIIKTSQQIAEKLIQGGKFFVFGSGHSHMIGEEFYARAGGLANVTMISPLEMTLTEHPQKSTMIERIPEYAHVIMSTKKISSKDVIMICSNSGRNGLPVQLAIECKKIGCLTIALTNMNHSSQSSSRHNSGLRLFEVCDVVIDNHGEFGDATISLEGVRGKMGATSTIAGAYIAQTMGIEIAKAFLKQNQVPPVFISSNVDEGDEWNQKIMEKYYGV